MKFFAVEMLKERKPLLLSCDDDDQSFSELNNVDAAVVSPRSSIHVVTTPRSAKWRGRAGRLYQEDRGFQSLAAAKRTIL